MSTNPQPVPAEPIQPPQKIRATEARATSSLLESIINQSGPSAMTPEMTQQLMETEIEVARFTQQQRLANVFAASGMFADIKGKSHEEAIATAMAKIEIGRAWNMTPADAMQFVYFVNGRPALMNEYFARRIVECGYWWDAEHHSDPKTGAAVGCTLWLKVLDKKTGDWKPAMKTVYDRATGESRQEPICESFMEFDAKQAKLLEKSGPWNSGYRKNMYYWRAMSQLRRFHVPHVLGGALSVAEAQDVEMAAGKQALEAIEPQARTPDKATVIADKVKLFTAGNRTPDEGKSVESGGDAGSGPKQSEAVADAPVTSGQVTDPAPAPEPSRGKYVTAAQVERIKAAIQASDMPRADIYAGLQQICGTDRVEFIPVEHFEVVMDALKPQPKEIPDLTEAEMEAATARADAKKGGRLKL